MISLLIYLVVFALVAGLIWWALQQIPLPAPVRMIVIVVFVLILVIALLSLLPLGDGLAFHRPLLR